MVLVLCDVHLFDELFEDGVFLDRGKAIAVVDNMAKLANLLQLLTVNVEVEEGHLELDAVVFDLVEVVAAN